MGSFIVIFLDLIMHECTSKLIIWRQSLMVVMQAKGGQQLNGVWILLVVASNGFWCTQYIFVLFNFWIALFQKLIFGLEEMVWKQRMALDSESPHGQG